MPPANQRLDSYEALRVDLEDGLIMKSDLIPIQCPGKGTFELQAILRVEFEPLGEELGVIMHGANDARVPPEQAVEFCQALRDLGKDVTYVSYPRQGHGIGEPRLQMDRLRRYVCAFTNAVGMAATTEQCDGGVPAMATEDEEEDDETAAASGDGAAADGLDAGILRVIEPD